MYEKIHREEVSGSAVSVISVTAPNQGIVSDLDGDRDEEYLLRGLFIHTEAGTQREFGVQPQGSSSNLISSQLFWNNTFVGATGYTGKLLIVSTTRDRYEFLAKFRAHRSPGGVAVSRSWASGGSVWSAPSVASDGGVRVAGAWDDTVTNLNRIDFGSFVSGSVTPSTSIGVGSWVEIWRLESSGGGSGLFVPAEEDDMAKTHFSSDEALRIAIAPFVNLTTGARITSGDSVTLVIKTPAGSVLSPPVVPTRDADTFFWTAQIPINEFQDGEWLIMASSDDPDTTAKFVSLTWGSYADSIQEIRQVSFGRWAVSNNVLTLYDVDGITPLQQFDLKDDEGNPTSTKIFERDPV